MVDTSDNSTIIVEIDSMYGFLVLDIARKGIYLL